MASDEAREILRAKVRAIEALEWKALDSYGVQTEDVLTATGRRLRVKSTAYWDMEEWASGMNVTVKGYTEHGWRHYWPYKEAGGRGGPDDHVPEKPSTDREAR